MSKKQRSLFVQSLTAIESCFSYRYDKHSSKHQSSQAEQGWRVCSYGLDIGTSPTPSEFSFLFLKKGILFDFYIGYNYNSNVIIDKVRVRFTSKH